MPGLIDHQVLQVTVAHRHQVCDRTVPGARLNIHVDHLLVLLFIKHLLYDLPVVDHFGDLLDALGLQEGQDSPLITINVLDCVRVVHEFEHAVVLRESQGLVGGEFKVEVHLLQQKVHELYDLKDDLVLPDIIAILIDNTVDLRVASS